MKTVLVTLALWSAVSIVCIELFMYGYRIWKGSSRLKLRRRLQVYSGGPEEVESPEILRKRVLSTIPRFNEVLLKSPLRRLDKLVRQANAPYPLGVFLLSSFVLALMGVLVSAAFTRVPLASAPAVLLSGSLPFGYLAVRKRRRMQKFQRQLPEALELIGRALRAGHAFTSGMKLAADNFDDPLGPEFEATLNEINFGVSVPDALKALSERIDCLDLKYFVVSVIIQREVGGNLAEVIESIARIVRERFRFDDKVRVLAAEGKFSAQILVALPFLIFGVLTVLNPEYIGMLLTEPMGKAMCLGAGCMMLVGIFIISKMIKIRV